jgi:uncharacterized membrane protein YhdT
MVRTFSPYKLPSLTFEFQSLLVPFIIIIIIIIIIIVVVDDDDDDTFENKVEKQ